MKLATNRLVSACIVVIALSVMAAPVSAGTPAVIASGGTTVPGDTVTVTVDIDNAQTVKVSGFSSSWTVESMDSSGAFTNTGDTYAGWVWDGDQSSKSVSVTLGVPNDASARDYTLDVTTEDSDGNTASTTTTVTVETADTSAPTADAGSDKSVAEGTAVSFDGTSSSDNNQIASYGWSFGDGTSASGPTPSHTYDEPGSYTARLTVTDGSGNTDTDSLTVEVSDTTAPTANAGADKSVQSGTAVTFDASASTDNDQITSYEWDFGDGTNATGPSPIYTYEDPGTYNATVTVTDSDGNTDTDSLTVHVAATPSLTASGGSVGQSGTVTIAVDIQNAQTLKLAEIPRNWTIESRERAGAFATRDDTYAGWVWESDQSSKSVSVTLRVPSDAQTGEYTLDAVIENSAGTTARTSATVGVTDVDSVAPTAEAGDGRTVTTSETVEFDGTASTDNEAIAGYEWDFGDGTSATGPTPSHTYAEPGPYVVTLTVTDNAGNQATETIAVDVESPPETTTSPSATMTTADPETTTTAAGSDSTTTESDSETIEDEQETTPSGSGDGPGFTAVTALTGLAGAGLAAARRRDDE